MIALRKKIVSIFASNWCHIKVIAPTGAAAASAEGDCDSGCGGAEQVVKCKRKKFKKLLSIFKG